MNDEPRLSDDDEIYALLPWYAAGTLSSEDANRVEAALARDPALARSLARVDEERIAVILDNEARPRPSTSALDRLMASIEEEAPRPDRSPASPSFTVRLFAAIAAMAPRTIAIGGLAAAAVIVAEGGFLANFVAHQTGAPAQYTTASSSGDTGPRTTYLVQFEPGASIDAITGVLRDADALIVDGPRAGGIFKVSVPTAETTPLTDTLSKHKELVKFFALTK